jgi:hypothetical protein
LSTEDDPEPLEPIPSGSRWSQRKSGDLVYVVSTDPTPNNDGLVVTFRHQHETDGTPQRMLRKDFVKYHVPFDPAQEVAVPPVPFVIAAQDEWESVSGDLVIVESVDARREVVRVISSGDRRRAIPFKEFIENKWRKIVRRSALDRLMSDDEEFG